MSWKLLKYKEKYKQEISTTLRKKAHKLRRNWNPNQKQHLKSHLRKFKPLSNKDNTLFLLSKLVKLFANKFLLLRITTTKIHTNWFKRNLILQTKSFNLHVTYLSSCWRFSITLAQSMKATSDLMLHLQQGFIAIEIASTSTCRLESTWAGAAPDKLS